MADDDDLRHYLEQAAAAPMLSLVEEQELAALAAAGDDSAAARLVRSSLRLVVALARRYTATGVPMLDLIQDGNLALIQAVERFRPDSGFAFRSFATWHIRRGLAEAIRKPEVDAKLVMIQRVWDGIVAAEGRQPSLSELAAATGLSEDEIVDLLGPPPEVQL